MMKRVVVFLLVAVMLIPCINISAANSVIDISTQRQLFTDDYIVDTKNSTTSRVYGEPKKNESVMVFDRSYEANGAVYFSVVDMHDGTYRMYYKATASNGKRRICYIESTDGLTWTRPKLSTNSSFDGSNIVTKETASPDNLFVFYDKNPSVTGNAKIKGIYGQWGDGLYLENCTKLGDSFQFWPNETKIMGTAAQMKGCYFDSLNTVYYDSLRGKYVAFVRGFHEDDNYNLSTDYVGNNPGNVTRDIRYAESDDCYSWSTPKELKYSDGNDWQMYTNAISPYLRAPQIYVGLPTRFNYSTNTTDVLFMSSRNLTKWERTDKAFLSPSVAESSSHGDCYPSVGFIETGDELSFYMQEKNSKGVKNLYRYSLRLDGFAYQSADGAATLVTKPFTFDGESLEVNYAGNIKVTLADIEGNSITSEWMKGDNTSAIVDFNGKISDFEGKTVTLTFEMQDAQLYSFKFNKNIAITADILNVTVSDADMIERMWYAKGEYTASGDMFASDTLVDISGKSNITVTGGGIYTFMLYLKDGSKVIRPVNVGLYNITYLDMDSESFSGILPEKAPLTHTYKATTKLVSPTKEGYTFGGWHNEKGTKITTLSKNGYTADITLYAKWTANSYKISYKDQGNVTFSGKLPSVYSKTHTYGIATGLPVPAKTGCFFRGWYTDKACETAPVTVLGATDVTSAVTLYAKWEKMTFDISYRDMGDSEFSGVYATGTPTVHTYGVNTTLKSPTKAGYTFGGWYLDPECTGSKVSSLPKSRYTADITLYAKWTANSYKISYKDQGNVTFSGKLPSVYSKTHTYGIATELPVPAKTGCFFRGWYTDKACETAPVTVLGATDVTSAVTLYAKWEKMTFDISYRDMGDFEFSGVYATGTPTLHTYGVNTTLKSPTKAGYTFGGWYLDPECTGTKISSLAKASYTDAITLYAKWTVNKYTITYRDKGNGTFSGKNPTGYATKHTYDLDTVLPVPAKTGYTFKGWYLDRACETAPVTVLKAGEYTASMNLYAKWEANVYSITYLDKNGDTFSGIYASATPATHTYGKTTILKNPVREGYTFGGWYTDASCTKKVTSLSSTGYTADIILYAKWTAK